MKKINCSGIYLLILLITALHSDSFGQGDNPCTATLLTVGPTCSLVSGTNSGATNSSVPDATCDGANSDGDVWYSAIIGANGTLIIKTTPGTLTDIGMAIYTGSSCSALTFNSCTAGGSPGFPLMPYKSLSGFTPGSQIWIRLWDVNNDETGTFNICANVNCSASVTITGPASGCTATATPLCATAGFSSYSWTSGGITACINVNSTATYSVTATDADGCTATDSQLFTAITSPTVSVSGLASACSNDNPQLCVPAGFTSYVWSNGGTLRCISPLSSGNYTITVTATNGCTASAFQSLTIFTSPTISVTGPPSKCNNGIEQLCVPSGYTSYLWSNGGTNNCISPTVSGTYSATVTDANSCTASASQALTVHAAPIISVTGPSTACPGTNPQLCVAGGYSTYSWTGGGNSNCISPTVTGPYTATVTDGFGCTGSSSQVITIFAAPTVTITGPTSACDGDAVQLCTPNNFNVYNWSNGGTNNCITPTSSGTYTAIVTDGNGCTASDDFAFSLKSLPSSTITGPSSSCNGVAAQLCAPAGNSFYLWSNNSSNSCISTATSGVYSVVVTGTNGCTSSSSFPLTVFPPYAMTISGPTTACNASNPQLCATAGNYTYQWSNGATTSCINPSVSGTYTVISTNLNGCTKSASKGLTVYSPLNPRVTGPSSACTGSVIPLCGSSGSSSFIWSTGESTECINVNSNGVYTVTISDIHGCTASASQTVTFSSTFSFNINGPISGCNGSASELCAPSGYTSYAWNTGETMECINVSSPGNYSVMVQDPVGCSAIDTFSIAFNTPPTVNITGSTIICKNSLANWCATAGFPAYLWSNGGTAECVNVSKDTIYSVQITDTNGCKATASAALSVVNISPAIFQANGLLICDTFNTSYTYSWLINSVSNGCISDTCIPTFSAIYSVIVTDTTTGCSETATYNYVVIGLNEIVDKSIISIYPNPFSENEFKIEFNNLNSEKTNIEIFDALGRLVFSDEFIVSSDHFPHNITLPSRSVGIYYVHIRSKGRLLVKIIVGS